MCLNQQKYPDRCHIDQNEIPEVKILFNFPVKFLEIGGVIIY